VKKKVELRLCLCVQKRAWWPPFSFKWAMVGFCRASTQPPARWWPGETHDLMIRRAADHSVKMGKTLRPLVIAFWSCMRAAEPCSFLLRSQPLAPQRFGLHMEDVAEGILHSPSREMVIDGIATTLLWRVALTCTAHDCVKRYAIIKQRRQGLKEAGVVIQ